MIVRINVLSIGSIILNRVLLLEDAELRATSGLAIRVVFGKQGRIFRVVVLIALRLKPSPTRRT